MALTMNSCKSADNIAVEDEYTPTPEAVTQDAEFDFGFDINAHRIKPEYVFYSIDNSIPEVFQEDFTLYGTTPANRGNSGFRVQIISTADVNIAEEYRRDIKTWLFDEYPQYNAETYLLFRQPFYRLHVGDFFSRAEAIEFSRIIKRKYPDAWVVHDQIDPKNLTREQELE